MQNGIFRERALVSAAQTEPSDNLLRVTAPREWAILAGFAVALFTVCVWLVFGSLERNLSSAGVLMQSGERHSVVSGTTGAISEIHVDVGVRVGAGAPLARVALPDIDWQLQVTRARVNKMERQLAARALDNDRGVAQTLADARLELVELEALASAGGVISSPRDGLVSRLDIRVGQAIAVGTPVAELRAETGRPPEAIVFLPSQQARLLREGMAARISITERPGAQAMSAEVVEITRNPTRLPDRLSAPDAAPPTAAETTHRVRVAVREQQNVTAADGLPCRVDFILGDVSPLGLLTTTAPSAHAE